MHVRSCFTQQSHLDFVAKQGSSRTAACAGQFLVHGRLHFCLHSSRPDIPVPRLDLLLILVLAAVCGAITASATGHFEPLPLFAGVIVAGVVRSLRTARQRG